MLSESQRAAYRYLRQRAQDGQPFSAGDIEKVAGWQQGTFTTYKTKHLKGYLSSLGRGKQALTIKPHFLRVTEEDFHDIVSQSRRTVAHFVRTVFDAVLRYEFLLPLTNERKLRAALDELFYRDHLHQRAREIGFPTLRSIIPSSQGESDEAYLERVVLKVGSLLGGYSIGHVSGRFRASGLKTHAEAAEVLTQRGRYLVDETTAVVRFLLPLQGSRRSHGKQFDISPGAAVPPGVSSSEVDLARRLFIAFFVESVILDIHGEDEIWFLESGPTGERLYVLEKEAAKPAAQKASRKATTKSGQLSLPSPLDHWLRENKYAAVADQILAIEEGWRRKKLSTRRNWWDILAGDSRGKPREVAGEKFPIIASIRKRQGLGPVPGARSNPGEKPPPPKD